MTTEESFSTAEKKVPTEQTETACAHLEGSMIYLFRELSRVCSCCVTNSKCPAVSAEGDTSMARSSAAGSPWRKFGCLHADTLSSFEADKIAKGESDLLGAEYLVRPHTEFRSQVFIHSSSFHPFGGLVVLPRHCNTEENFSWSKGS